MVGMKVVKGESYGWHVIDEQSIVVADLPQGTVEGRAERLAKRFAAADDMYEALEAMLAHVAGKRDTPIEDVILMATTALRRARGED